MRKATFFGFMLLGAALGVIVGIGEGVGLATTFGCVGAVAGAAIGGAATGSWRRTAGRRTREDLDGLNVIQGQQTANYWLDRGRLTSAPGLPHADDTDPHHRDL